MVSFGNFEVSRKTLYRIREMIRLEPAVQRLPASRAAQVMYDGMPRPIEISREISTISTNMRWLNEIPEDAIITPDKAQSFSGTVGKVLEALEEMTPSVRDMIGPPGTFDLENLKQDIRTLTDKSKGVTVRRAYKTLAGVYGYVLFRVVGAAAVIGIPHLKPAERVLDTIAAAALLGGEGVVRMPTGLSFAHTMLRALARGPEYYDVLESEKVKGDRKSVV